MASELEPRWDGSGAVDFQVVVAEEDDAASNRASSRGSTRTSQKAKPRAKRGAALQLSSSFTSWKNCRESNSDVC